MELSGLLLFQSFLLLSLGSQAKAQWIFGGWNWFGNNVQYSQTNQEHGANSVHQNSQIQKPNHQPQKYQQQKKQHPHPQHHSGQQWKQSHHSHKSPQPTYHYQQNYHPSPKHYQYYQYYQGSYHQPNNVYYYQNPWWASPSGKSYYNRTDNHLVNHHYKAQGKEIYKGESKAYNEQTQLKIFLTFENTPYSADAIAADFIY